MDIGGQKINVGKTIRNGFLVSVASTLITGAISTATFVFVVGGIVGVAMGGYTWWGHGDKATVPAVSQVAKEKGDYVYSSCVSLTSGWASEINLPCIPSLLRGAGTCVGVVGGKGGVHAGSWLAGTIAGVSHEGDATKSSSLTTEPTRSTALVVAQNTLHL